MDQIHQDSIQNGARNDFYIERLRVLGAGSKRGGQASVRFAINEGMAYRLEAIKFYTLKSILEHEKSVLAILGSADHIRFPTIYNSGKYENKYWLTMSISQEPKDALKFSSQISQMKYDDLLSGKILPLEDAIFGDKTTHSGKQLESIILLQNMDYKKKLKIGITMLESLEILHDLDIVHNDYKPSQVLLLFLKRDSKRKSEFFPKTLDFGMHLRLGEIDSMDEFLITPSTPLYAHPIVIQNHLDILSGRKTREEVLKFYKSDLKWNFKRDEHAAALTMLELLYGINPLESLANKILLDSRDSKNKENLNEESALNVSKDALTLNAILEANQIMDSRTERERFMNLNRDVPKDIGERLFSALRGYHDSVSRENLAREARR